MCTAGDAGNLSHRMETIPKGHSTIPAPTHQPGRALGRQHPGQSRPRHGPGGAPTQLRASHGHEGMPTDRDAHGPGCQAVCKNCQLAWTLAYYQIAAEFLLGKRDKHKRQRESLWDYLPSLSKAREELAQR